jgi:hypothetical protein
MIIIEKDDSKKTYACVNCRVGASAAAENSDSGMVLASFLYVAFAYKNRGNWPKI